MDFSAFDTEPIRNDRNEITGVVAGFSLVKSLGSISKHTLLTELPICLSEVQVAEKRGAFMVAVFDPTNQQVYWLLLTDLFRYGRLVPNGADDATLWVDLTFWNRTLLRSSVAQEIGK